VEEIDVPGVGLRDVVLIGAGEILYALDAVDGSEVWRFRAGTGRVPVNPDPNPAIRNPQCLAEGERNQIESSVYVANGLAFFGMDVNDEAVGKGGVYAVDVRTGHLVWFFDLESGKNCVAQAGDDVTAFDPYHSEVELGLPAGFRSRPGCDFPFSPNGCGNVWSSAAVDLGRQALFIASSNCDTDGDPTTNEPPPPMPPYDEAIFSLDIDTGAPRWVWRPREIDNDDLAFGGVPNLFSIDVGGAAVDVVGVGGKDGTYYVIDRDGVNQANGVAWDDLDPSQLPYWWTQVVPGGALGGIIATAAVDIERRRVFFSTAPGDTQDEVETPQLPTMHALDMDTGAIVWDNGTVNGPDASFSPTSALPGLAFTGSILSSRLRAFETQGDAGTLLLDKRLYETPLGFGDALASGGVVINGTLLIGEGVGFRGRDSLSEAVSKIASPLIALCVPGEPGCDIPRWVLSDLDADGVVDQADLTLFSAALGSSRGDVAFNDLADLDRDGTVSYVDYQLWLKGQRQYELSIALAEVSCGLLGVEPLALLAMVAGVRRLRRRRRGPDAEAC
jgi:outer membrane protein assembly factor BamB